MNGPDDNTPNDPLDDLLSRARWPRDGEAEARLAARYKGLRRRESFRLRIGVVLAAAAAAALAAGVWWAEPRADKVGVKVAHQVEFPVISPPAPAPEPSFVREATPYERVVLAAHERRLAEKASAHQGPDPLEAAVNRLAMDGGASVEEVACELDWRGVESKLIAMLSRERGPRAVAVVQLLGEVGTAHSLPILLRAAGDSAYRPAAVAGLVRLADASTLADLARTEPDTTARRVLMAAILNRKGSPSLTQFLALVEDAALRDDALAALDHVQYPPSDAFWSAMDSPRVETRLAAARAVGRVADEEGLKRLATLTRDPARRGEAVMALACSTDSLAAELLAAAGRDPALAALIELATSPVHVSYPIPL